MPLASVPEHKLPSPTFSDCSPTWRGSVNRAAFAAVILAIFIGVTQKNVAQGVILGVLAMLIYVPMSYYTDRMLWRRRQRQKVPPVHLEPTSKAFLRGLLPFEKGEALLGRDGDLRQVLAKVTSSEFRFSYISGEAGSGKTSLLRAGLLSEAEKAGLWIIYTSKPGAEPACGLAQPALSQSRGRNF